MQHVNSVNIFHSSSIIGVVDTERPTICDSLMRMKNNLILISLCWMIQYWYFLYRCANRVFLLFHLNQMEKSFTLTIALDNILTIG